MKHALTSGECRILYMNCSPTTTCRRADPHQVQRHGCRAGSRCWESPYHAADCKECGAFGYDPRPFAVTTGLADEAHNFASAGGTDIHQSISLVQGNYTVVMQWDDGSDFDETQTDLDIYLSNEEGTTLFGFNRDNTGEEPIEVLPFTDTSETAESNIMIIRASGSGPVTFKCIVFRGLLTMNEYANIGSSKKLNL